MATILVAPRTNYPALPTQLWTDNSIQNILFRISREVLFFWKVVTIVCWETLLLVVKVLLSNMGHLLSPRRLYKVHLKPWTLTLMWVCVSTIHVNYVYNCQMYVHRLRITRIHLAWGNLVCFPAKSTCGEFSCSLFSLKKKSLEFFYIFIFLLLLGYINWYWATVKIYYFVCTARSVYYNGTSLQWISTLWGSAIIRFYPPCLHFSLTWPSLNLLAMMRGSGWTHSEMTLSLPKKSSPPSLICLRLEHRAEHTK